jgi:tRNA threonylcarbamoyladenosine biosynthesis protein TsaB
MIAIMKRGEYNIMNILAIETTGPEASVAILNDHGMIREEVSTQKLNHLQNLIPMVDHLLKECKLSIDDVSLIAASEGPGSFTGIRIGIASARALAQALEIDTISVPTLKSFAYNVPDYKGIICPIFDARRNQVYGAAYRWGEDGLIQELVPGDAYDLAELLDKLKKVKIEERAEIELKAEAETMGILKEITFFGDGIHKFKEEILTWQASLKGGSHDTRQEVLTDEFQASSSNDNIRVLFAKDHILQQKASSIARLAFEIYKEDGAINYAELKPVYMRKSEAERKLERKLGD